MDAPLHPRRAARWFATAAALMVGLLVAPGALADPAVSPELVPFTGTHTITATWGAPSNGYHADTNTARAIDIDMPIGTPVYAAGSGTVTSVVSDNRVCNPYDHGGLAVGVQWCIDNGHGGGNNIKIEHPDGRVSRYLHLSQLQVSQGQVVSAGQQIALSGNTGITTGPHLHYAEVVGGANQDPGVWVACHGTAKVEYEDLQHRVNQSIRNDGYGCASAPPADSDGDGIPDSADVCPSVPGAAAYQGCPTPRIGVVHTDGTAEVKEGRVDAGWVLVQGAVKQMSLSGNRIGVVMSDGTAWVKEGGIGAGWVLVNGAVKQIALSGNRIGVVHTDGTAEVKEGRVDAGWVVVQGAVKQMSLSGSRIGVVLSDGRAYVKEGRTDAGWVLVQGAVKQISLSGNRVGVVLSDGTAEVKEGGLDAGWVVVQGAVKQMSLSGNRIGVVLSDGRAYVKEGGTDAGWVLVNGAVKQIVLSGNRIGVVHTDGAAEVKEGRVDAGWVLVNGAVAGLCLTESTCGPGLDDPSPAPTPVVAIPVPTVQTPAVAAVIPPAPGTPLSVTPERPTVASSGSGTAPSSARCVVPRVVGLRLGVARTRLGNAGCRVGRVTRVGLRRAGVLVVVRSTRRSGESLSTALPVGLVVKYVGAKT